MSSYEVTVTSTTSSLGEYSGQYYKIFDGDVNSTEYGATDGAIELYSLQGENITNLQQTFTVTSGKITFVAWTSGNTSSLVVTPQTNTITTPGNKDLPSSSLYINTCTVTGDGEITVYADFDA